MNRDDLVKKILKDQSDLREENLPRGEKWLRVMINRLQRSKKMSSKPLKPSPRGRSDLVKRQKKARPVIRSDYE